MTRTATTTFLERSSMLFVAVAAVAAVLAVSLVGGVRGRGGHSRRTRLRNAVVADVRGGVLRRNALPAVVLASALVVIGHAATFFVAG